MMSRKKSNNGAAKTSGEKYARFQRIAQDRKNHILECLHALGNCSAPASYAYDSKALIPIFRDIVEKLAEVWHRLNCHSPYSFIPFRLNAEEWEIGSVRCRRENMMPMADVLDILCENSADYTALVSVREQYADRFGSELCWTFPLCSDDYLGCVILFVREGALYLPYSSIDSETYEQFDLASARLLTAEKVHDLMDILLAQAAELYTVLADVCRYLPMTERAEDSAETEEVD